MWLKHIGIQVTSVFAPLILFSMLGQCMCSISHTYTRCSCQGLGAGAGSGRGSCCGKRTHVHTTARGEPMPEQAVISWKAGALGGAHAAAGGKYRKKGAAERKLLCTDCNPPPAPTLGREWGEELGAKESSWAWDRGEERCCSIICLCFSLPKSVLTDAVWNWFSPNQGCFACSGNW